MEEKNKLSPKTEPNTPDTNPGSHDTGNPADPSGARSTGYLGTKLKGRYLIEKRLGRGGLGVVYLARDQFLMGKLVVIKILLQELDESSHIDWFRKKFQQEIEAMSRIDHPGVVGVLDAGEMPDGRPYLVMQFIKGKTLGDVMEVEKISLPRLGEIIRQTANALAAAHDKGVFHRDIKPENIMLQQTSRGEEIVRLIDFGVATVKDSQVAANKKNTMVAGTVPYMAPEQLKGRPSAASDIFGLAVVAYQVITGQLPFEADSVPELYELHRQGLKHKPRSLCPDLSVEAEAVLLRAMSFDPAERHPDIAIFGNALAQALTRPIPVPSLPNKPEPQTKVTGNGSTAILEPAPASVPDAELAQILYIRLVGYSAIAFDKQPTLMAQLQQAVRNSAAFIQARQEVISLPVKDGLALAFFQNPVAPVECALEISKTLKPVPHCHLAISLHSGLVHRLTDLNARQNISGNGLDTAETIAGLGERGHILVSQSMADVLKHFSHWSECLHDLGELQISADERLRLFNFFKDDLGNTETPARFLSLQHEQTEISTRSRSPEKNRSRVLLGGAVGLVILALVAALFYQQRSSRNEMSAGMAANQKAAETTSNRALSYWLMIDKARGVKLREPRRLSHEILFAAGDEFQLTINSTQAGWLYVINESPRQGDEGPLYNLLFPASADNGGTALLNENQQLVIPKDSRFIFDQVAGTEKIWLIWSAESLPVVEAAKKWNTPQFRGRIGDREQARQIADLLRSGQRQKPESKINEEQKQTELKSTEKILVHCIFLEHG